MPTAALFGARQLIDAPQDPEDNNDDPRTAHTYGLMGVGRVLLNYERWDELLERKDDSVAGWQLPRQVLQGLLRSPRMVRQGRYRSSAAKSVAAHAQLKSELDKNKDMERTVRHSGNGAEGAPGHRAR